MRAPSKPTLVPFFPPAGIICPIIYEKPFVNLSKSTFFRKPHCDDYKEWFVTNTVGDD